jgi:hypothetical protein
LSKSLISSSPTANIATDLKVELAILIPQQSMITRKHLNTRIGTAMAVKLDYTF